MSSLDYVRSIFSFNRVLPFPTGYPENKTPVTVDVLEVGWIVAFVVGYVAFMLLVPTMAAKERVYYSCRMTLTSLIGLIIMVCNFGHSWEVGTVTSKMLYRAGTHQEIEATVGVRIGLRAVNITLYADHDGLRGDLAGETINYNERFYWTWVQGRSGFGPFAGEIQRSYREAQLRGIPYPILWVAEFFVFDGEGLRLGRHYRHAGWYAHIAMWCAAVCWVLDIILFKLSIKTGSMILSLLGCFMLVAALIWCFFRNHNELEVIFNNNALTGVLRTHYGANWYLALITGLFCIISGTGLTIADQFYHDNLCKFFGLNPFAIFDEDYVDALGDGEKNLDENQSGIEMMSRDFKKERKMTVIYKSRAGQKKIRANDEKVTDYENEHYFNTENNPAMDDAYINYGVEVDPQAVMQHHPYFPNQGTIQEDEEDNNYHDILIHELHQPNIGYRHPNHPIQPHGQPNFNEEDDYSDVKTTQIAPPPLPARRH